MEKAEEQGIKGFSMSINDDRSFTCMPSYLSSTFLRGTWRAANGILIIEVTNMDKPFLYTFKINKNDLTLVCNETASFFFVEANNGDRFVPIKD